MAQRLADLADILNAPAVAAPTGADSIERHLSRVNVDRIRGLARDIERHADDAIDGVNGIVMRLLLDEYVAALAHLRAAMHETATMFQTAPAAVKDVRRYVIQQRERQEQQRASAAPSER